jgi:hypothetical protein
MRTRLLILLITLSTAAVAQRNDTIEYFTDSDVHRSIVSVQAGYMPYYTSRRLLSESANPQAGYFFLDQAITGKFGQGFGGDVLFNLNGRFQVGVGLYSTSTHYQWDFVSIVSNLPGGNVDTLQVLRWDIKANYLTVPIQFGFVSQVADQWWLQVYPALELNFLQQLEYDYLLAKDNEQVIQDRTQDARDLNLAINFGLGAEYRVVPKFGVFTRLSFRYFFFPAIEDEIVTEVVYTIGGHIGVRYYF